MKKLVLLVCALFTFAALPAHAEETVTPVKRPRQMRKKPPVEVVDDTYAADDEDEEPAPRPRSRRRDRDDRYEREDRYERGGRDDRYERNDRRRDDRYERSEPAYQSSYEGGSFRTSHWQVGMDLLGPAIAYSFGGSYLFGDHFAVNAGVSAFSITTNTDSGSLFLIPLSGSGLFGGPDHHFEVTAGVTPVIGSARTTNTDGNRERVTGSGAYFTGGIGYRYWPALGGFHFRATGYVIAGNSAVTPWLGFQFGYAF